MWKLIIAEFDFQNQYPCKKIIQQKTPSLEMRFVIIKKNCLDL